MDPLARINEQVTNNPIIIYMKGTPQFPQCGFSARAAQALQACNAEFAYVNVFEDTEIYENLPRFANWPTFPQVYVGGELIGGCDIVVEMFERGELAKLVAEVGHKDQSVEQH
jgi:monothiol glutaredoxin